VKKAPGHGRPRVALGLAYMEAGRLDAAERQLLIAVDLEPWDQRAVCALEAVRIRRSAGLQPATQAAGLVTAGLEGNR